MSGFKSIDRAIRVLFAFTKEKPCLTAEDIATATRLPRGSIYRYINALVENGLLEKNEDRAMFTLGYKLLYFQSVIHYDDVLETSALPLMQKLSAATSETISLTIIREDRAIAIKTIESSAGVRVAPPLGRPSPLHAGANNKAILAFRPEEEWDRVCAGGPVAFTTSTITDRDALYAELRRVREAGYAVSIEEMHPGAWGVAAPICNSRGLSIASLGVSGPLFRNTEQLQELATSLVTTYAREISDKLRFAADS